MSKYERESINPSGRREDLDPLTAVIARGWTRGIHCQWLLDDSLAHLLFPADILGVRPLLTLRDMTTGAHGGKQVNDKGENVTRENESNNCRSQYAKSKLTRQCKREAYPIRERRMRSAGQHVAHTHQSQ